MNTMIDLPLNIREVIAKGVPSAEFEKLWGKVLEALSPGLVPYISLVELICGGEIENQCLQCKNRIRVDHFLTGYMPITLDIDDHSSVR